MKSIFLIDDDPIFVYLTRRIIASINCPCKIVEFTDGELAISRLNEIRDDAGQLPDVIFLDLSMPVMDGWEFLNEYSQLKPKLKKDIALFIVSSSISPQEVERSKTYRAVTDFLIKPVEKGKIVEIMDNVPEAG
ncbi:MAG TPA: response regulator [Puia sp.]|nr:response regulator [Puia sp.]